MGCNAWKKNLTGLCFCIFVLVKILTISFFIYIEEEAEPVPSKSVQTSIRVRNPPGGKSSGIF